MAEIGGPQLRICRQGHRAITFFDSIGECPMCALIKHNQELEEEITFLEAQLELSTDEEEGE